MENLIKSMIEKDKEKLIENIDLLIVELKFERDKLCKLDNYTPNDCGIIQRRGTEIDDLCKSIGIKSKIIDFSKL